MIFTLPPSGPVRCWTKTTAQDVGGVESEAVGVVLASESDPLVVVVSPSGSGQGLAELLAGRSH